MKKSLFLVTILMLSLSSFAFAQDKELNSEQVVVQKLKSLKADDYNLKEITDPGLVKLFPKFKFFSVIFRQFPVGTPSKPGVLENSNIFVVHESKSLMNLTDEKHVQNFLLSSLPSVKSEADAKDATKSFLMLSWHTKQDGFFTFKFIDESIQSEITDKQLTSTGKYTVEKGGNGTIQAKLTFNNLGGLTQLEHNGRVLAGPRPICQATKLLDRDPLVRRMAEQDILVMGSSAKSYLDYIRPQLSPELKAASDKLWNKIVEENR